MRSDISSEKENLKWHRLPNTPLLKEGGVFEFTFQQVIYVEVRNEIRLPWYAQRERAQNWGRAKVTVQGSGQPSCGRGGGGRVQVREMVCEDFSLHGWLGKQIERTNDVFFKWVSPVMPLFSCPKLFIIE
jgi:hypothetical protein